MCTVADLRGARGMRTPLVQILSISCSFWENLAKSYVGAPLGSWRPLLGEILDPPLVYEVQIPVTAEFLQILHQLEPVTNCKCLCSIMVMTIDSLEI